MKAMHCGPRPVTERRACRGRPTLLFHPAQPGSRVKVRVRLTARTVEIFHQGQRVAAHARTSGNRQNTTIPDPMPASHRRHSEWSPAIIQTGRLKAWAAKIGPNTATLIEVILCCRSHLVPGR